MFPSALILSVRSVVGLGGRRLAGSDPGFGRRGFLLHLAGVGKALARLLPVLMGLGLGDGHPVHRHGSAGPQTGLGLSDFQLNLRRRRRETSPQSRSEPWQKPSRMDLTGSFIPVPSFPRPSPFFQPIFSSIFRPLLTSLISLFSNSKDICVEQWLSGSGMVRSVRARTRGQKLERRLAGRLLHFPPFAVETLLGLCTLDSSLIWSLRTPCSASTNSS